MISKKLIKTHGNVKKPWINVIKSIINNLKFFDEEFDIYIICDIRHNYIMSVVLIHSL